MNGFLLDTVVISELTQSEPYANVLRWIHETEETILFLSVLTLGDGWSRGSPSICACGFRTGF